MWPVPAPPATKGDPGSGVSVPSGRRSKPATVLTAAVMSLTKTCVSPGTALDATAEPATSTNARVRAEPSLLTRCTTTEPPCSYGSMQPRCNGGGRALRRTAAAGVPLLESSGELALESLRNRLGHGRDPAGHLQGG